mmetsp:Transcript_37407/g.117812  ORF Transcript_37407/g.117812 Transcript_37407/m.117812 type:complete len:259 (-) Transcript_37407:5041-5817(-)
MGRRPSWGGHLWPRVRSTSRCRRGRWRASTQLWSEGAAAPSWRSSWFQTSTLTRARPPGRRLMWCLPSSPSLSTARGGTPCRSPSSRSRFTLIFRSPASRPGLGARWRAACSTMKRRKRTARKDASACPTPSRRACGSRGWKGSLWTGRGTRPQRQNLAGGGTRPIRGCSAIARRPSSPLRDFAFTRTRAGPVRPRIRSTISAATGTSKHNPSPGRCAWFAPSSGACAPTSRTSQLTTARPRSGWRPYRRWRSPPATF